jgi:2-octaprenyl-6-methoxyphenol hydroxylase
MAARSCTGQRIALIAEAAHVLSPIGAQGLNLSLRDVRSLYQHIIAAHECGLDYGSAAILRKYEQDRQMDIALLVAATHGLNQMVATDNPVLAAARRMGLKAVSTISPLRALIMEQGFNPGQARTSGRTTRARVTTSTR